MSNRTIVTILAVLGLLAVVVAVQPVFAWEPQGCTPGYWKQPHHSWPALPATNIREICEDVLECEGYVGYADIGLMEALRTGGGHEKALFRHGAAALLNFYHDGVSFVEDPCTICGQIAAGLQAEDPEFNKDILQGWNELGCPLD
jgi:hypothetical protein